MYYGAVGALSAAQSAASDAISVAQASVNSAASASSAAESVLQEATTFLGKFPNLASGLSSYLGGALSGNSIYFAFTVSRRGPTAATVAVNLNIHGNVVSFSTASVSLPVDTSAITSAVTQYVTTWLASNVVIPANVRTFFTTLRLQTWRRRQLELEARELQDYTDDDPFFGAAVASDPVLSLLPTVFDYALDFPILPPDLLASSQPLITATYNNASGLYELGGSFAAALPNSPAYSGWFPCTACSGSATAAELAALTAQGMQGIPVTGQDGDLAALNRVALGTQLVSVWKDSRQLGKVAGEAANALAEGKKPSEVANGNTFADGAKKVKMDAILIAPQPITMDNLDLVIKAGWISKEKACAGANPAKVAACK